MFMRVLTGLRLELPPGGVSRGNPFPQFLCYFLSAISVSRPSATLNTNRGRVGARYLPTSTFKPPLYCGRIPCLWRAAVSQQDNHETARRPFASLRPFRGVRSLRSAIAKRRLLPEVNSPAVLRILPE